MPPIHVTFVDAATQHQLGKADLPAEQLPESFAADTTLHLGGTDWHVERAEPMTRSEYVASGQLRLVLRKIERVDPRELLFSLPTLENTLPPLEDGEVEHALVLHEDDWRQRELVASRFEPEAAAELAEIRAVHAERKGAGFPRLHVREHIPEPLAGVELTAVDVQRALGEIARRPLGIGAGVVPGGFAFVGDDAAIYGREVDGRVVVLAASAPEQLARLTALAIEHDLLIVDWCRAMMQRPKK